MHIQLDGAEQAQRILSSQGLHSVQSGSDVRYALFCWKVTDRSYSRPDDLPPSSRTSAGDIGEMRMTYDGWDPV
jgi:hypothetical protein